MASVLSDLQQPQTVSNTIRKGEELHQTSNSFMQGIAALEKGKRPADNKATKRTVRLSLPPSSPPRDLFEPWIENIGDPTLADAILDRPVLNAYRLK